MAILMPKATAVWLVDNTTLTFEQIADLCGLHHLEVKGIADGEVAKGMMGVDPVSQGELTREEIEKGQANPKYKVKLPQKKKLNVPPPKRKGARYTPVARRQDRPNAIAWFVKNHPEVTDAQISKLIGTTKSTIGKVRNREHWNSDNIQAVDPVTLGLCSQIELDGVVAKAAAKRAAAEAQKPVEDEGPSLTPATDLEGVNDEPSSEAITDTTNAEVEQEVAIEETPAKEAESETEAVPETVEAESDDSDSPFAAAQKLFD